MSNIGGEEWNLVFLDTNAISNLISNYKNFRKNLLKKFDEENVYYVFSIYNAIEISNGDSARFELFKDIFSKNKCLMFLTYQDILKEEYSVYKGNVFDYSNVSFSFVPNYRKEYDFKYFMEEKFLKIKEMVDSQSQSEQNLIEFYNNRKKTKGIVVELSESYETEVIKKFLNIFDYKIEEESKILQCFISCRMINKSVYDRIAQGNKKIGKNDLYDIMISAIFPYVDTIITEKYQAEMINQMKRKIFKLKENAVYRISEFYNQ